MAKDKVAQTDANEAEAESETQLRAAVVTGRTYSIPLVDMDRWCVFDHLAIACDQLGEAIATEHGRGGDGDPHQLLEALTTLWRLRWEMGFTGGEVVADYGRETREELISQRRAASKKGQAAE